MIIDYPQMNETIIPNFKGGDLEAAAKMYFDGTNRIMVARLIPGASIGMHTHEDSSEILYVLSGTATILCDGVEEIATIGQCHYCPKGSSHTTKNLGCQTKS